MTERRKNVPAALEALSKELRDLDRGLVQAINERDAAEECLSQMYYVVTGRSPEWSNRFGHAHALEDVADAVSVLKQAAKAAVNT